jgi:hypothetical protein
LIATNTLLFTNIFSLNTAANNNAANVTSISNRVIQAEVTNSVQQTALAGLTNSIGTKQFGSAALTNLSAQVNVATNIIGAGFGITVSSNNAGTWTITGATTNYIATTNGMSRNLTNLGEAYFDRISSTNIIITNGTDYVSITNGVINTTKHITSFSKIFTESSVSGGFGIGQTPLGSGGIYTLFRQGASQNYDEVSFSRSDNSLLGMMTFGYGQGAGTPALMVTNGNIFLGNATRTFNSGTTNSTTVAGLRVGFQAFSAVLTNTFTTNVVWDFPSTSVGAVADLGATITGVKDGDTVIVSPPQAAMTSIIGSYSGFASNGVAYGRFLPLAVTQDPASGTFRVVVHQYR